MHGTNRNSRQVLQFNKQGLGAIDAKKIVENASCWGWV